VPNHGRRESLQRLRRHFDRTGYEQSSMHHDLAPAHGLFKFGPDGRWLACEPGKIVHTYASDGRSRDSPFEFFGVYTLDNIVPTDEREPNTPVLVGITNDGLGVPAGSDHFEVVEKPFPHHDNAFIALIEVLTCAIGDVSLPDEGDEILICHM
jgi:hypothetical protein